MNIPPKDKQGSLSQSNDPPARVGRLATFEGWEGTAFHVLGETKWSKPFSNAPVTTGDAYWTGPSARIELEVAASSLWMDRSTELDILSLNENTFLASEPQGEVYIHLTHLHTGEKYTVETPRGTVTIAEDGRYEITAGDKQKQTMVTVLEGAAQITENGSSLQVNSQQSASISGTQSYHGSIIPLVHDDFLTLRLGREPAEASTSSSVVTEMAGGSELNYYGKWEDSVDYGQIWFPDAGREWVPYHDGRWCYVAPWGWTWLDASPWGFAPFHYGRWLKIGSRWGWVPNLAGSILSNPPTYAPALVRFFGIGIGVQVGSELGLGSWQRPAFGPTANIGWVPLGPNEPYFPSFPASQAFLSIVNAPNVRETVTAQTSEDWRNVAILRYTNSRAASVVSGRTMIESMSVNEGLFHWTIPQLSRVYGIIYLAPLAPGGRTLGLTRSIAQEFNVEDVQMSYVPGPPVASTEGNSGQIARPALRPGPR